MNELAQKDSGKLVEYLLKRETGLTLPKPFERDIYLFETYVAGTTHIDGIEDIGLNLKEEDKLIFFREPENIHDPQAVRIETLEHEKIGYIPRQDNIVFSRLMDAGKELFGTVREKEMVVNWLKIIIKIYLHES